MRAVLWTDYICPWCYLARDRTALMRDLGVEVESRPYELHPDIPPEGRRIRPDGRLTPVFDHIEAECRDAGLEFRRPERFPNSRRALETAEVVRLHEPESFPAVDQGLFRLHWVDGGALDDPDALAMVLAEAGVSDALAHEALAEGSGRAAVDRSMDEARSHGITATPTWRFEQGFLIPGVQPRATVERWVARIVARSGATTVDGVGSTDAAPAPTPPG